jgi:hypothetical protein
MKDAEVDQIFRTYGGGGRLEINKHFSREITEEITLEI